MRSARQLADWTRSVTGIGDPHFLVHTVAAAFDIPVRTRQGLGKAGTLELDEGRITILVDAGVRTRRRFSAAHELGHYLLAAVEDVPLTRQTKQRRYEHYCNAFASDLLLPRPWLTNQLDPTVSAMSAAIGLADRSECSLMAVVGALNTGGGWERPLVQWRRNGKVWNVVSMFDPTRDRPLVESSPSAYSVLDAVGRTPTHRCIELMVGERDVRIHMEVVRRGNSIFGLGDRSLAAHA